MGKLVSWGKYSLITWQLLAPLHIASEQGILLSLSSTYCHIFQVFESSLSGLEEYVVYIHVNGMKPCELEQLKWYQP